MPEGHTIHRLARDVRRRLAGQALGLSSPQGPFAGSAARLDGRVLDRVDAHGKHLFLGFGEEWVHVHLGLFGRVTVADGPAPTPRGAVRLRLVGDTGYLDLRGPTACELIDEDAKRALHARLGADPLRRDADPTRVFEKLRRRRLPMGAILLDQSVVAGIGNVYRAELLHRAALSPYREARDLAEHEWVGLWDDTVHQLRAVRTFRAHRDHGPRAPGTSQRSRAEDGRALRLQRHRPALPAGGAPARWCRRARRTHPFSVPEMPAVVTPRRAPAVIIWVLS